MINFRYHIVSIIAVFLALAIGIVMGTTVIDKATVDTLRNQLDSLESDRRDDRDEIDRLQDELNQVQGAQRDLGEEAGAQLLDGHLDGVPVVVVATRGVDGDSVDSLEQSLVDSGATYGGTVWLTDKLALDSADKIDELGQALGLTNADADRDRRTLVNRLGALFTSAARPFEVVIPGEETTTTTGSTSTTVDTTPGPTTTTTAPAVVAAPLLEDLRTAGFLDWDAPQGADDIPALPASGARYVFVSGHGAEVADADVLLPLLDNLAASGPAPVVAGQATASDAPDVVADRVVFVGSIRDDDLLRDRVSTVDDLETFAGWAAVVLALQNLPAGQIGHYGVGDGSSRLVPQPVAPP
jgi:hypothetical protein